MSGRTYIPRHLSARLDVFLRQFPIVLVQGARQVGKSTFLRHHLRDWTQIDLEDVAAAQVVEMDPGLYLRDHPHHIWFDEAQRLPELFAALRVAVDRDRRPGRYVLSGSASPAIVRKVSESLAGRAGILQLGPLSVSEAYMAPPSDFLQQLIGSVSAGDLMARLRGRTPKPDDEVISSWFQGGYPEPYLMEDDAARLRWAEAYVRLLSERDLRELTPELHPRLLFRLLRMIAARHGQILNVSALARDFGATTKVIGRYLDILEGSFIWLRLPSYQANIGKRLTKSPKAYLRDSGLLHALLNIGRLSDLEISASLGASWEGWVLNQIWLQADLMDGPPEFFFWRTQTGGEVDLVLEQARALVSVEVKRAASISHYDLRGTKQFLQHLGDRARFGVIIYRGAELMRAAENIVLVPIGLAV